MKDFEFKWKWWGMRVTLSHSLVQRLQNSNEITDCLMSAGGAALVASGVLAAPLVAAIAAFIKLELVLIKRLDKGKGVHLTNYIGAGAVLWIPQSVKLNL